MSATDRLRSMLTERGVEWWQSANTLGCVFTRWYSPLFGDEVCAMENGDEGLVLFDHYLTPEQAIATTLGPRVTGNTSDGYHTFNELYHHRAVLFSVIVRDHRELAWKSMRHRDGTMYDGMFIVGIETPEGQATYHYDIDPYWDMFDCKELERAPEWDGHTPDEAIERIATLGLRTCKIHDCEGSFSAVNRPVWRCDCGAFMTQYTDATTYYKPRFCPNCGAKVVSE